MSDGTLSIRRRDPKASQTNPLDSIIPPDALRSGTYESFLGGVLPAVGEGRPRQNIKGKSKAIGDVDELRVESRRKRRLREYDRLLKSFKYGAALDSVLRKAREYTPLAHLSLLKMDT